MVVPFPVFTTAVRRSAPKGKWETFRDFIGSEKAKVAWGYAGWTGAFIAVGGGLAIADRLIRYWAREPANDEKVKDVKLNTTLILREIQGHRSESASYLRWLRTYHEHQAAAAEAAAAGAASTE